MSRFGSENVFGFDNFHPSVKFSKKMNGDILSLNNSLFESGIKNRSRKVSMNLEEDLLPLPVDDFNIPKKPMPRRYSCSGDVDVFNGKETRRRSDTSDSPLTKEGSECSEAKINKLVKKLGTILGEKPEHKNLSVALQNGLFQELLEDKEVYINGILIKEIEGFIKFEKDMKRKKRVKANFDLIESVLDGLTDTNASVLGFFIELSRGTLNRYKFMEKKKAITKYLTKKKRRKDFRFIRYHVRKELAGKRLRYRGKFIKKPKVDLEQIARELNSGGI